MEKKHTIKVASVQMDVVLEDKAATQAKVLTWVDRAAREGADVVLFPELILSAGYSLGEKFYPLAEPLPGPASEALGKSAQHNNLYIIIGMAERDLTGTVFNTAFIVGRDGSLAGVYRKSHIFTPTESFFAPGDELPLFDLDFGRVAIPICYDLEFPEVARVLCLKGAQILFSMAAHWVTSGTVGTPQNFIRTIYAARALENRVPVVLSNRVGYDAGLNDRFVGLSRIVDADGMTVAEMQDDSEGMILATIDLLAEERKRLSYNYFRDRKPLLYSEITRPK